MREKCSLPRRASGLSGPTGSASMRVRALVLAAGDDRGETVSE